MYLFLLLLSLVTKCWAAHQIFWFFVCVPSLVTKRWAVKKKNPPFFVCSQVWLCKEVSALRPVNRCGYIRVIVWLQNIEWFTRNHLDKAPTDGHKDRQKDTVSPVYPLPPSAVLQGGIWVTVATPKERRRDMSGGETEAYLVLQRSTTRPVSTCPCLTSTGFSTRHRTWYQWVSGSVGDVDNHTA